MTKLTSQLTDAEINHLRRLLAYVECEIGQAPEEMVETLKRIAPAVNDDIGVEAYGRLEKAYEQSVAVPQYIRQAIKALKKTIVKHSGEITDVDSTRVVQELGSQSPPAPAKAD